jgi:drug/metabolite transporter (DMT)-like permease
MPDHHPIRGAVLCIAALALFACMDTTTKYLTQTHEVPLIVGVRYLGNLLLMAAFLGPTHGRQMIRTRRTGLVWIRAFCLAVASLLIGFALQRMPVAEMTAITFLSPILLVAVAGRLLGERVGWIGWAATVGGFTGVMLIVRPGSDIVTSGAVFVLASVLLNLGYQLLSRVLAASENTFALLSTPRWQARCCTAWRCRGSSRTAPRACSRRRCSPASGCSAASGISCSPPPSAMHPRR